MQWFDHSELSVAELTAQLHCIADGSFASRCRDFSLFLCCDIRLCVQFVSSSTVFQESLLAVSSGPRSRACRVLIERMHTKYASAPAYASISLTLSHCAFPSQPVLPAHTHMCKMASSAAHNEVTHSQDQRQGYGMLAGRVCLCVCNLL